MLNTTNTGSPYITTKQLQEYIYHNLCKNYINYCIDFLSTNCHSKTITVKINYTEFTLNTLENLNKIENKVNIAKYYLKLQNPLYSINTNSQNRANRAIAKKFIKQLVNKLTVTRLLRMLIFMQAFRQDPEPDKIIFSENYYYHWLISNFSQVLTILNKENKSLDQRYTYLILFLADQPNLDIYLLDNFEKVKVVIDKDPNTLAFFFNYLVLKRKPNIQEYTLLKLCVKELIEVCTIPDINLIVSLLKACLQIKIDLPALPLNYLPLIYACVCNTQDKYKTEVLEDNLKHLNFKVVSQSDLDAFKRNLKQVSMPNNDIVIMTIDNLIAMLKKYQPKIDKDGYQAEIDKVLHYKCENA